MKVFRYVHWKIVEISYESRKQPQFIQLLYQELSSIFSSVVSIDECQFRQSRENSGQLQRKNEHPNIFKLSIHNHRGYKKMMYLVFAVGLLGYSASGFSFNYHGGNGASLATRLHRSSTIRMTTSIPVTDTNVYVPMRPREEIPWSDARSRLIQNFGYTEEQMTKYDVIDKKDILKGYETMQLCRQFENACNQAYMQGHIRGFMHLDNGQEVIPAIIADNIRKADKKYSYYREHTHALASGVSGDKVMAELFAKVTGTCKGAGGSMHIYDKETNFQGGWALVSEQLPYAAGAARSILLDRHLFPEEYKNDDRVTVVFIGEGGAQNGRMAECMNAAAKENLPLLFLVIDNGRAINTFTPDVAANSDIFDAGKHYGIPGVKVDGQNMVDAMKAGRAVFDYVRKTGPAILHVHTYRFLGHSPADPEHERGRKDEKKWIRAE
eukprot:gene3157-6221_t